MCGQQNLAAFALDSFCGSHHPWRRQKDLALPTRRFRKRQKVWSGAQSSPITPLTPGLVPFSRCADALLSQAHTSKTCVAFTLWALTGSSQNMKDEY